MNKIKSCIAVALATLLTVSSVSAATIDKLDIVQNTVGGSAKATITVSGTSDDSYVSLAVVNPDADEAAVEPSNGDSVFATYQMLKNIKVEDGKYSYSYTVTDAEGVYTLKVNGAEPKEIPLITYGELDTFLTAVNGSTSSTEVCALFEDLAEEFAIDNLLEYSRNNSKIGAAIIEELPFEDTAAAEDSYKKNALSIILSNPSNIESALYLADLYNEELALDDISSYEVYKAMSDDVKEKVFEKLANVDVTNFETFTERFGEQIIFIAIDEAESYGEVQELLDGHTDIIDIDWEDALKNIKATSEIYKGLKGNYYKSVSEFEDAVEDLVKAQKKKENKDTDKSDNSGVPGILGGTPVRVPKPVITPAEDTVIFTDLGNVAWAETAIYNLAEKKILSGMGNGIFAPEAVVTREQFVQGIVKAFGFTGAKDPGFVDVKPGDWYYESVCIAYANGVVSGVDETHFGVGKVLTREEMATLVWRAMEKKGYTFKANAASFGDFDTIGDYAKDAANAMYAEGIISGFPSGNFEPRGECTRAQMAVVLDKAYERI